MKLTTLLLNVAPAKATNTNVSWTSNNESVVTVSETGTLTAIAPGEATITVTTVYGEFVASVNVIVVENLLVNGSFEDGLTAWTGPEASLSTNDYFPVTGSHHLSLLNTTTEAVQLVENLIPGSYVLMGYIRNNPSSVPEEVRMGIRTATDTLYISDTFNTWPQEPYSIRFTIKEDQSSVEVFVMNVQGSDFAYADNLKLYYAGPSVSGVALNLAKFHLATDDSLQLSAVVFPSDAVDPSVTWTSSDDDVVVVNNSGLVTSVATGEATITVTTNDGGFSASIDFRVVDNLIINGSFEDGYDGWEGPETSLATHSFFPVHGRTT
jgi:uncharacterized protein YjdB